MLKINSEKELNQAYKVESLGSFGLKISTTRMASVTEISGVLINELASREKILVFRGFQTMSRDGFLEFSRNHLNKNLLEWDFGPVMEMKESPDPKNYLFSSERVPYHWDGAFFKTPNYLLFNCIQAPPRGAGGETLFCNTESIWKDANATEHALWSQVQLTYVTDKLAHYGGTITGPLVQKHPVSGSKILRFAEPVTTNLNPVRLSVGGLTSGMQDRFLQDLTQRIYSASYSYKHQWRENDILMADNHSLIHGREAFTKNCSRHLRRIQLM